MRQNVLRVLGMLAVTVMLSASTAEAGNFCSFCTRAMQDCNNICFGGVAVFSCSCETGFILCQCW